MARLVKDAAGRLLEVVSDHDPRGMTVRTTSSDRTRLTGRSRSMQPLVSSSAREAAFFLGSSGISGKRRMDRGGTDRQSTTLMKTRTTRDTTDKAPRKRFFRNSRETQRGKANESRPTIVRQAGRAEC